MYLSQGVSFALQSLRYENKMGRKPAERLFLLSRIFGNAYATLNLMYALFDSLKMFAIHKIPCTMCGVH